jgi:hypothetical protein
MSEKTLIIGMLFIAAFTAGLFYGHEFGTAKTEAQVTTAQTRLNQCHEVITNNCNIAAIREAR